MTKKEIAYQFWNHMTNQHFQELEHLFYEDAVIQWPNTNEIFSVKQFIIANASYPGEWKETVKSVYEIEEGVITETLVEDKEMSFIAISIFQIKEHKIATLKEFWSPNGEAPAWRKALLQKEVT